MSDYRVSPAARDDLVLVWRHYALELRDVDLADRIQGDFVTAFRKLAKAPGRGHLRRDLADGPVRFWKVNKYLIVYGIRDDSLEIVRVLHGARDVEAILGD